ncbi:MAG: CNNM domain-containing protein [Clostridia bacterium]|nr:CNNM domain-containing protein [Clostridia bacterium]
MASVNRIHMISMSSKGVKGAENVLKVLDNFDEALSVLLIGNNIASIAIATLSVVIATDLFGKGSVSITTVLTSFIIFLFGEMLPKSFASSCNEKFALKSAGILLLLMKIFKPFSFFLSKIGSFAVKFFKSDEAEDVTLTEEELNHIVENISQNENFDKETGELVKSALRFSNSTVQNVLVPWDEVLKIRSNMKTKQILEIIKSTGHSRIPVVDRNGDIKGILQIRKFLKAYINKKQNIVLASVIDYPYFAKINIPLDDLLTQMSNHKRNLAIIKNLDGEIAGIVTVEDILEELVGEIYDEDEKAGVPNA